MSSQHTPSTEDIELVVLAQLKQTAERHGFPHDIEADRADFRRWYNGEIAAAEQRGAAALAFELFPLMRHIQNLPSRYTRAPGPGGNGDRVADLLSQDAYKIGAQAIDIISEALQHTEQEGDDEN